MARKRTFIGFKLSDEVVTRLGELQESMAATGANVKWVTPENFHLTLFFLGDVDDRELYSLFRIAKSAAKREPAFTLGLSGVGAFPTPRRPKVIWAGIGDGAESLIRLQAAMEPSLLEFGSYRREERAYTPHITLGRVESEADGEALLPEWPTWASWSGGHQTVEEVMIFASEMRREGPEYTVLGRAPLGD